MQVVPGVVVTVAMIGSSAFQRTVAVAGFADQVYAHARQWAVAAVEDAVRSDIVMEDQVADGAKLRLRGIESMPKSALRYCSLAATDTAMRDGVVGV